MVHKRSSLYWYFRSSFYYLFRSSYEYRFLLYISEDAYSATSIGFDSLISCKMIQDENPPFYVTFRSHLFIVIIYIFTSFAILIHLSGLYNPSGFLVCSTIYIPACILSDRLDLFVKIVTIQGSSLSISYSYIIRSL